MMPATGGGMVPAHPTIQPGMQPMQSIMQPGVQPMGMHPAQPGWGCYYVWPSPQYTMMPVQWPSRTPMPAAWQT